MQQKLAEAMRYALSRWAALSIYIDDGRVEIDNNIAERATRPLGIGRKNWLFAGSDKGGERIANILTIIETVKLHGHNPEAYLTDVLTRIQSYPEDRLEELLRGSGRRRKTCRRLYDGTKGLTENGIDDLQTLIADIRTWDGGIRQFLLDQLCDPEMIERVTADEAKRSP